MFILNLYDWAIDFLSACHHIVTWLFTSFSILTYDIKPIYLVVGAMATVGLLRRVL